MIQKMDILGMIWWSDFFKSSNAFISYCWPKHFIYSYYYFFLHYIEFHKVKNDFCVVHLCIPMTEPKAWRRLSPPQITAAVFLFYNAIRASAKSPFCDCQQDLQLFPQNTGWLQGSVAGFNSSIAKTSDEMLNLGPDELLTCINRPIIKVPMSTPDSLTMGLKK